MRMALTELDLELDPAEEVRWRVEDESVDAWLKTRQEVADPPVGVRLALGDELPVTVQLDTDVLRRAAVLGVEHVGGKRGHRVNLSAWRR